MEEKFVIHCIGDSHVNFFTGYDMMQVEPDTQMIKTRYSFFKTYWMGPVLAYNLCVPGSTTQGREKLFEILEYIPRGSILIFCFGEIDCRANIIRQAEKQGKNISTIVSTVTERYFCVLKEIQDMGYRIIIWNVIPSAPSRVNKKLTVSKEYFHYGTCEERNKVSIEFNNCMKELAKGEEMFFLDFFDRLLNKDGTVNGDYYGLDEIHISQKAMPIVIEELGKGFPEINGQAIEEV